MLKHKFRIPPLEREDEWLRSIRRGTFRGLFEDVFNRLKCFARIHEGGLQADKYGFFKICDRCMHYERIELWLEERKK
jgi:hypothetical protein